MTAISLRANSCASATARATPVKQSSAPATTSSGAVTWRSRFSSTGRNLCDFSTEMPDQGRLGGSSVGGVWEALVMTTSTDSLVESTANYADVFATALGGGVSSGDEPNAGLDVKRMTDAGLLAVLDANFTALRAGQALLVRAAGELSDRFEHDSGIAARTGNRNAAAALTDIGPV